MTWMSKKQYLPTKSFMKTKQLGIVVFINIQLRDILKSLAQRL